MTSPSSPSGARPDVLWYTRCPVPSPLGIAARQGWLAETFAEEGIAIESIIDSKDRSIRESHFDHHLAWSFRQGGNIPPIWARANGRATRLVAITWTDEFQAIVTLPDRGIASAEALAGRRLAVPRRVNDLIDFHRATALKGIVSGLSLAGLSTEDVTLVELPIEESVIVAQGDPSLFGLRRRHPYFREVEALVRGEVDAIFLKGAEGVVVANLIGAQVVAEFGNHPDPKIRINNGTPRVLTVDDALSRQRPRPGGAAARGGRARRPMGRGPSRRDPALRRARDRHQRGSGARLQRHRPAQAPGHRPRCAAGGSHRTLQGLPAAVGLPAGGFRSRRLGRSRAAARAA